MSKEDRQKAQADKVSGGSHLGGTNFGQQSGDANTAPKEGSKEKAKSSDKETDQSS